MKELLKKIFYILLGLIFKNRTYDLPLSPNNISKILIFRYDVFGDMIVSLPAISFIKKYLPSAKVFVLASKTNYILIQNHTDIENTFVLTFNPIGFLKLLSELRRQKFDLILNFVFNKTTKAGLLANFINCKSTKVTLLHQKRHDTYSNLFNIQVPMDEYFRRPVSEFLCHYVAKLFNWNINRDDCRDYNLTLSEDTIQKAQNFIKTLPTNRVAFVNTSARKKERNWRLENYLYFIEKVHDEFPELTIVVNYLNKNWLIDKIEQINSNRIRTDFKTNNFFDVIALIKFVDLVFTPDTSIVHVANVFQKPIVFLHYPSGQYWIPNNSPFIKISSNKVNYSDIDWEQAFENFKKMYEIVFKNENVEI